MTSKIPNSMLLTPGIVDPGVNYLVVSNNITHATHANRVNVANQSVAVTLTFANAATSGALDGDYVYVINEGTGAITANGAISAPTGFTLTTGQGTVFGAVYSAASDSWYSVTPSPGSTPLTVTAMQVPNGAAGTIVLTLSASGWQGTLPAVAVLTVLKNGSAWTASSWTWTNATTITVTMATSAVYGDTITLAYTENATARIHGLITDIPLQSFAATTVVNNVTAPFLRFLTLTGLTESGTGPYVYTTNGSGEQGVGANLKFLASTNGQVIVKASTLGGAGTSSLLDFWVDKTDNTSTPGSSSDLIDISYSGDPTTSAWAYNQQGVASGSSGAIVTTNPYVRLVKSGGTSPTFAFATSPDGVTFTTQYTTTVVPDIIYYFKVTAGTYVGAQIAFTNTSQSGMG